MYQESRVKSRMQPLLTRRESLAYCSLVSFRFYPYHWRYCSVAVAAFATATSVKRIAVFAVLSCSIVDHCSNYAHELFDSISLPPCCCVIHYSAILMERNPIYQDVMKYVTENVNPKEVHDLISLGRRPQQQSCQSSQKASLAPVWVEPK